MFRSWVLPALLLVMPQLLVGFAYERFLGQRSDYLGHFLAGFGGTLGAVTIAAWGIPRARYVQLVGGVVVAVVVACIALGAVLEQTLYHIAKWDEVDFCNQSLGAVLAGLAALAGAGAPGQRLGWTLGSAAWAGAVLLGGYYFAFR
ncbi:MAG: hypothetical protein JNG90_18670 [Planctomycetaceae bacterium]|nr:hypothetical protein [Planctomycetaceae bacterium]